MTREPENSYTPQPIDTLSVTLPEERVALAEDIAKNVHEVRAKGRVDDGWKWGEVRSDEAKTHPCIVPYEFLPEAEKDYDRRTAEQTLKLIVKLGFKISK